MPDKPRASPVDKAANGSVDFTVRLGICGFGFE
jgi:hypothetical protein